MWKLIFGLDGTRPEMLTTSVSISVKPKANREKLVKVNSALARHQWLDMGTTGRGGNTPLSHGAVVGGRETVRAPGWNLMKRGLREQTWRRQKLLNEEQDGAQVFALVRVTVLAGRYSGII